MSLLICEAQKATLAELSDASPQSKQRKSRVAQIFLAGLAVLFLGTGNAQAGGTLPTNGQITAGAGSINPGANRLTINQSSLRGIINWNTFSIGAGQTVQFNNGNGATLNRVTGGSTSQIDGLLSATGSVYLLNPDGVLISSSGRVNTAGSFVASTLDLSNAAFMAGGALTFTGASTAAVTNLGAISATGGDVFLIARTVSNDGAISAPTGTVGFAGGSQVLIQDATSDQRVFVQAAGGDVTNTGSISAAQAELKTVQGNVYALAGNTSGVIRATGTATRNGSVWLVAAGSGNVTDTGTIAAQNANGTGGYVQLQSGNVTNFNGTIDAAGTTGGGYVETSGHTFNYTGGNIDAGEGGTWLIDPTDITLNLFITTGLDNTLNAGTNEIVSATGNVTLQSSINWSTGASLLVSAGGNINFQSFITNTGSGNLTLQADNTGTGTGSVIFSALHEVNYSGSTGTVSIYYNPLDNAAGSVVNPGSYTSTVGYAGGTAGYAGGEVDLGGSAQLNTYMLVNTVYDLQNIQNNLGTGINYALGRSIDASSTVSWNSGTGFLPIGNDSTTVGLQGALLGQNYTVTGLYVNQPDGTGLGLFSYVDASSVISNLGLINATILGNSQGSSVMGALAGDNEGQIIQCYNTGTVSGGFDVGGLVGLSTAGLIKQSYSTAAVTGSSSMTNPTTSNVGGLIGANDLTANVTQSYATGTVTGDANSIGVGGLAGRDSGAISYSYSSGAVTTGTNSGLIGGLVGIEDGSGQIIQCYSSGAVTAGAGTSEIGGLVGNFIGTVSTDSYWDVTTTGQAAGSGGGHFISASQGLTTAQMAQTSSYTGTWDFTNTWYLPSGMSHPILLSELQPGQLIENAHQLELIGANATTLAGNYTQGADFSMTTEVTSDSGPWFTFDNASNNPAAAGQYGFLPIGTFIVPFSGNLNGQGYAIDGLNISSKLAYGAALFTDIGSHGSVTNLGLTNVVVTGLDTVGALAGINEGTVSQSYSTGVVTGNVTVGGLVADNQGTLTQSYSTANTAGITTLGGLVGRNEGILTESYSSGSVIGILGGTSLGGLVGENDHNISQSYSSGAVFVIGGGGTNVGGLVGLNVSFVSTDSYWDVTTSGQASGAGLISVPISASQGLTTAQMAQTSSYAGTWDFTNTWYLGSGMSHPILVSELTPSAPINNAHQLELIGTNATTLAGNYVLGANISTNELAKDSGPWFTANNSASNPVVAGDYGFLPIGSPATTEYSGSFSGAGHTIDGLIINQPTATDVALFGGVGSSGVLNGIALTNVNITGLNDVAALVGENLGNIATSYSTGTVSMIAGGNDVGGLVALNAGTVAQSYSTVAVVGGGGSSVNIGGLVAYNDVPGVITQSYASGTVTGGVGSGETGGLVGRNFGTINQSFATGVVSGGIFTGGLVGDDSGTTSTDSFWDMGTTGQATGAGGGTETSQGLTTAQAQSNAYLTTTLGWGGNIGTAWGIIDGQSYPYLLWRYSTPPQVVSGIAAISSPAGVTVVGVVNGTAFGQINTGANGFYYFLLNNSTLPANAGILTYLSSGSTLGNAVSQLASISGNLTATGMNITANTVSEQGGAGTTLVSLLPAAKGGASNADILYSVSGSTITLTSGDSLDVEAPQDLTVDDSVVTSGMGTVTMVDKTGSNLTLNSGVTITSASASGDAIVLVATNAFINNSGAGALVLTGGGNWNVYSNNPGNDTFGSLNSNDAPMWNATYNPVATRVATGNLYYFAFQPNVTFTSTDVSKSFGLDDAGVAAAAFTPPGSFELGVTGVYNAGTQLDAYSGAPSVTSLGAAAGATAAGSPYAITVAAGTLTSPTGYGFIYDSAGLLTVNEETPSTPTLDLSAVNVPAIFTGDILTPTEPSSTPLGPNKLSTSGPPKFSGWSKDPKALSEAAFFQDNGDQSSQ